MLPQRPLKAVNTIPLCLSDIPAYGELKDKERSARGPGMDIHRVDKCTLQRVGEKLTNHGALINRGKTRWPPAPYPANAPYHELYLFRVTAAAFCP